MRVHAAPQYGLGLIVGAALLCTVGCQDQLPSPSAGGPKPTKRLTIITPHSDIIQREFQLKFSQWYTAKFGTGVDIKWIARGTPRCVEYIEELFTLPADAVPRERPAVMFGGGIEDHAALAAKGRCQKLTFDEKASDIPPEVAGLPTRDAQGRWYATGLTSFGIVFNESGCRNRHLEIPQTWDDLADPRFFGWVGIADPRASGSNRESFILILQKKGWAEGWATIVRILGNSRALLDRSAEVLDQVRHGVFLAGFAANFDGMTLAGNSDGAVRYVNPPAATAVTPDVVSVLTCAEDGTVAAEFVRFVISEQGQALWGVAPEHRHDYGDPLYHYPISPRTYEKYAGQMAVPENPTTTSLGLQLDLPKAAQQAAILKPLVRAACDANHVLLQRTWEAVIKAGLPAEPLRELTTPPFDEPTAYRMGEQYEKADPAQAAKMHEEWSAMFRAKYQRVLTSLGGEPN